MADIDYGAVFGVDISAGANDPAPAEQDSSAAEAAEAETETVETTESTDAGEKETEPAEQSEEENARYAAARRKAEQERDAAIAQAREEAQRSLDDAIKALGQTNPYTGKAVTTKAEYDEWKRQEAEAKRNDVAEAAGMDEQEFDGFIDRLPKVQEYKREADAARAQRQKMLLDEQVGQISKIDPSVKTVEDLLARPEYRQIYETVQNKRVSIVEAFKLVNYDTLVQQAQKGAKQAAMNAAASKDHLTPTQTRGEGAVAVPSDVKAQYRLFNPDATDAEIQAHYARFHKT